MAPCTEDQHWLRPCHGEHHEPPEHLPLYLRPHPTHRPSHQNFHIAPRRSLETGEVEWMELEGNSNSGTSAAFLDQLRKGHAGPLNVIWDNAPAHRGEAVREYLRTPELELRLMNLPGYSPDFNADEAIWGWAREEATGNPTKALVHRGSATSWPDWSATPAPAREWEAEWKTKRKDSFEMHEPGNHQHRAPENSPSLGHSPTSSSWRSTRAEPDGSPTWVGSPATGWFIWPNKSKQNPL